ncbi:hypothetical protein F5B19DRAFT_484211 [Rostrohypoxylon terebratum]|nr:hypothetical protein F5B19DRAFT_484211 [Rostrohypoxylon terebratum]
MCKSTGWTGQPVSKPAIQFIEHVCLRLNLRRTVRDCFSIITPDNTRLLLPYQPLNVPRATDVCANESQAEKFGLKSFSAFREPGGPFEALIELVQHTWVRYTREPERERRKHGFRTYPACIGQEILAYFFVASKVTQLHKCRNSACEQRREALERVVPRCEWPDLETMVVRILACWVPNVIHVFLGILLDIMPEDGRGVYRDGFDVHELNGRNLVYEVEQLPSISCLEVDGVIDLCRWMFRVAYGGNWGDEPRLCGRPANENNQLEALLDYHGRGPCPNRLWNVPMLGSGGVADFPQVANMAISKVITLEAQAQDNPHHHCTEQLCLFSHLNSTLVPQRHVCNSRNCGLVSLFTKNILHHAFSRAQKVKGGTPQQSQQSSWTCSSWNTTTDDPTLCGVREKYMAISHVWSDGTGERSRDSGEVNTCLMSYFTSVAERLGCSGIWWDAITVPTGPYRTAAIDKMLINYENAAATLVHDLELVEFEWRNDGSPAVALVLSSWFTRGWTAAELFASRNHPVKVLFGNPKDILAWDPMSIRSEFGNTRTSKLLDQTGSVPSYGHFIATDILRRLRDDGASGVKTVSSLRDLLLNLRARVTSWVKDQLVIPGLMCLDSLDSTATGPQITRDIVSHFREVFCSDLFHGEIPITPCGPWSWCPSRRPSAKCTISKNGLLSGTFTAYTLTRRDVVVPFGRHPAMASRISEALRDRRNCLILTDQSDRDQSHRQYILAIISCRWSGCVYLGTPAAIDSHEGQRPPLSKPHISAKELGFSNGPAAASSAVLRYASAMLDRRGTYKWPIGTEITKGDGTFQWERRSQPVSIYPPGTTEMLRREEDDVHSSLDAIIYESRDHNALDPLVMAKLPFYCKEEPAIQACEIKHEGCSGIVNLEWSFPHGPVRDKPILRRIFRSPFHIMKTGWTEVDIRIGWLTYSNEIAPHCKRVRVNDVDSETHIQILQSSIVEGSMSTLDWNGPLRETEIHERRPKKISSSNNLRNDTRKGPTFEELLKDMGLQHKDG